MKWLRDYFRRHLESPGIICRTGSVVAANPTFVSPSASAAAVPATQPLGEEGMRKLLSGQIVTDVEKARREAGVS